MNTKSKAVAARAALGLVLVVGFALRLWYGSFGLRLDRFEDEQHSWPNVQSILETGTLVPVKSYYPYPLFNLPPAALIALAESASRASAVGSWTALTEEGEVAARALFLCRLWPIAFGTLAIFLTFVLGRRIFSTAAGLIGALLLAFSPQAIHSSGYFKPDAQLLCLTLLAFLLALRAIERPNVARYALSGLGIALAASSKILGGVVAVPLALATLLAARRRLHDLLLLVIAAMSSMLSFILLNPYWRLYPAWLANIRYHYAVQAKASGETQFSIPWRTLEFLLQPTVQSPWLTGLGLAGFVGLTVWLWTHRHLGHRWLARLMFLIYPVIFVATYALTTAYFKGNNFVVLLPFTFLASGWVLVSMWTWARGRWGLLRRPAASALAGAGLLLLGGLPGPVYTYSALVPPTSLLAQQYLARHLKPPDGRLVYLEDPGLARPGWEGWPRRFADNRAAFEQVADALEIPLQSLALVDGLSVSSASLERPEAEPLSSWLLSLHPGQRRTFEPRAFRARGPVMTAAYQVIPSLEPPRSLTLERCPRRQDCLFAHLPSAHPSGELDSVILDVKQVHFDRQSELPRVELGGQRVSLAWASWRRDSRQHRFISSRVLHDPDEPRTVTLSAPQPLRPQDFGVALCRWQRVGSGPE